MLLLHGEQLEIQLRMKQSKEKIQLVEDDFFGDRDYDVCVHLESIESGVVLDFTHLRGVSEGIEEQALNLAFGQALQFPDQTHFQKKTVYLNE